jgi:hypothetical protein
VLARATAATLAACLAAVLVGAAEPPHLEAKAPKAAVSVGDRVNVQVTAVGDVGAMWGELSVDPSQQWAVVDGPRTVAAADPPAWTVDLAPLATGTLALPEMSVSVRGADGAPRLAALVERPEVTVASVLPPGQDPKPAGLRAPIGVHGLPWEWILPGLLAALPIIGGAVWALRRRRPSSHSGRTQLAPLAELETEVTRLVKMLGDVPSTVTCDRMATALRRYLERRSGEPALEMTSFELRLAARRLSWPEPVQRTIQGVMAVADGIRFGRRQSSAEDLRRALRETLELGRALEAHLVVPEEAAS